MPKHNPISSPQILTASDLLEGDVIYLSTGETWTRQLSRAHLFTDAPSATRALEYANTQPERVLGAYLTNVALDGNGQPAPMHFREGFRATGPSNRFIGKQAEQAH